MRCDLCNGTRCKITGSIPFRSKPLGEITVPSIEYYRCRNCGDISIDNNEAIKINNYIQLKENEAISSLPIKDFISQKEACEMLGVSKQAFSKNSRIKRGFIYSVTKDGRKYYYKHSVEEFKRTGKDGRLNICQQNTWTDISNLYIFDKTIAHGSIPFYSVWEDVSRKKIKTIYTGFLQDVLKEYFPCDTIH
jgi:predicted DNA-binding protein (UPF0251 family)